MMQLQARKKLPAPRKGRGAFCSAGMGAGGSVAAAAAADFADEVLQGAVFAHAVCERGEDGPTAAAEHVGREDVPARSEDREDDENPKIVVAAGTAIHGFSSLIVVPASCGNGCRRVCNFCSAVVSISYAPARGKVPPRLPERGAKRGRLPRKSADLAHKRAPFSCKKAGDLV